MATTRKILSKGIIKEKVETPQPKIAEEVIEDKEGTSSSEDSRRSGAVRTKKACQFCSNRTEPHYFDMVALRRFLNDRGRIITRTRSGSCSKHQRRISKEIKRARHLALLPFTVKV